MSTFGRLFRVTTFGESHCTGVGCIVDGVPPGLSLTEDDIQPQLTRRRPGQSKLTTPRDEKDRVTIMSGTEIGRTLGTPIALFVPNEDIRPQDYSDMSTVPRPGHADYMYQIKYGTRASSGGGRASARETIGRVAAGAIAEKWLFESFGTKVVAWVSSVGRVDMDTEAKQDIFTREEVDRLGTLKILRDPTEWSTVTELDVADAVERAEMQKAIDAEYETRFVAVGASDVRPAYEGSDGTVYDRNGNVVEPPEDLAKWKSGDAVTIRCPHASSAARMATEIREVKHEKDSTGGVVTCVCTDVPMGLGEPVFDKLEALLAHAMLSLPATKGFEIGSGFKGARSRGSEHNDPFGTREEDDKLIPTTNNAGGTLGGISSGCPLKFHVAVKPVSTIGKAQKTVNFQGEPTTLEAKGRHDPCVLPRVGPLVEAMSALVLADCAMLQRSRRGDLVTV